jgi:hypothetical protein
MYNGQKTTVKINGEQVHVKYLGAGRFKKAYLKNDNKVLLFAKHSEELHEFKFIKNPHVPVMNFIEYQGTEVEVFETDFSETLKAKHKQAWADYKLLTKYYEQAFQDMNRTSGIIRRIAFKGYEVNDRFIRLIEDKIDSVLFKGLKELNTLMSNLDSTWWFEFCPKNLGVDESGRLILRDSIYDMTKLPWCR